MYQSNGTWNASLCFRNGLSLSRFLNPEMCQQLLISTKSRLLSTCPQWTTSINCPYRVGFKDTGTYNPLFQSLAYYESLTASSLAARYLTFLPYLPKVMHNTLRNSWTKQACSSASKITPICMFVSDTVRPVIKLTLVSLAYDGKNGVTCSSLSNILLASQ